MITTVLAYPGVPDGTLSGTPVESRWEPRWGPDGVRRHVEYENRGERPPAHGRRTLGCAQRTLPGMIIVFTRVLVRLPVVSIRKHGVTRI